MRRPLPLLAALLLLSLSTPGAARALSAPSSLPAVGVDTPLPACRYADVAATRSGYDDYAVTLVDTAYRLPDSYVPPDLVPVARAGVARLRAGMELRALVIADLRAMDQAARTAGVRIVVRSAYRSAAYQRSLYAAAVRADGRSVARRYVARPGHSEHQLGTTIDLGTRGGPAPYTLADWATTKTGRWVNENAWRFGFIRSYPTPSSGVVHPTSCYASESWHFRYVGRERAAAVRASGLTLRAWLWAHREE